MRADAARVDRRADDVAVREREVEARARSLERAAREQTRAYLLEARRKVEEALSRARAAVDEATAREARRLVEEAINETSTDAEEGKREGWLSLEELRRRRVDSMGGPQPVPSPARPARGGDRPSTTATTEVSLIGLRAAEAEPLLVRALDDAILADLPHLRVIHGKGTGALRQLVHDVLSRDTRVKRFGFAPANQGGSGVTVAEFTS